MSAQDNTSLRKIISQNQQRQRSEANDNDASSTSSKVRNPNFMRGSRGPVRPPVHEYPTAKPESQEEAEKGTEKNEKTRKQLTKPLTYQQIKEPEQKSERFDKESLTILDHKLSLLLQSHSKKQQEYTETIKTLKQDIYNVTQSYMETLTHYKKQLHSLLDKRNNQEAKKQKYQKMHELHFKKNPPNKYHLIECNRNLLEQMDLNCEIKILDIQLMVEDYMTENIPKKIKIRVSGCPVPFITNTEENAIVGEGKQQEDVTQAIVNSYPLDICTKELKNPVFGFKIQGNPQTSNCIEEVLSHFQTKTLGISIIDSFSMLPFCSGRIDLQQFLYCNQDGEQQQWISKIAMFSQQNPSNISAYVHVQSINRIINKIVPNLHSHKVSEPLNMIPKRMKADKEARIVQRISSYKNQQSTIIPQLNKYAISESDKLLLEYKKRKQLQEIEEYKESHKKQYMEKLFKEAVQIYQTQTYSLGECRYLGFLYTNKGDRAERVTMEIKTSAKSGDDTIQKTNKVTGHEVINVQILKPESCYPLLQNHIIQYPPNCSDDMLDYIIDADGKVLVMSGYSVLVFAKVIVHSVDKNCDRLKVSFHVQNEYAEEVHHDIYILKITQPKTDHKFRIDMARGEEIRIKVDLMHKNDIDQKQEIYGKAKAVNILKLFEASAKDSQIEFEYLWQGTQYQNLEVKIQCGNHTSFARQFSAYIFIYDVNYISLEGCYQVIISVCPVLDFINKTSKMIPIDGQQPKQQKLNKKFINIGESVTFLFDLMLPVHESDKTDKVLVRLGCSDITNQCCLVTHKGSRQFLCEKNKNYPIQISYLTFKENPRNIKETITVVDQSNDQIIRKYLLFIEKNPCSYRKIYSLYCPSNGEIFTTTLDLYNSPANNKGVVSKQKLYRLKTSNPTYIRTPTQPIVLMSGQSTKAKLEVQFWSMGADFESGESHFNNSHLSQAKKVKDVVVSVDDGTQTLLYLYQLREQ